MLNPQRKLHRIWGKFLFYLPHHQQYWRDCMGRHRPVLENSFPGNEAALLMVMRIFRMIDAKNIDGALTTIRSLANACAEASNAEKALINFLGAMAYLRCGNSEKAFNYFFAANKYGHRYYLPFLYVAEYYTNVRRFYGKAAANYQTTIDCIYDYLPLTGTDREILSTAYAGLCFTHTLMHCYDEAKADLLHAEQMIAENAAVLHARSYLHAALRQPAEARSTLTKYKTCCPEEFENLQEQIERILADQDPHFTKLPIGDAAAIASFWQYFLDNEDEILRLLRLGTPLDATALIHDALERTDPDDIEDITYFLKQTFDENRLYFGARYAHTNNALIDQLLDACPPEIRKRWHIIREP